MLAFVLLLPTLERFAFNEPHMGTTFRVIIYASDEAAAGKAARAAFERIKQLDGIMSDYKPASELMQLCAKAGGPPVKVSDDLLAVLVRSRELSRKSDGAFDITIGPVVRLWRFARKVKQLPTDEELKEAMPLVGQEKMILDPKERTVRLAKEKMRLDLGGIGKGHAADEALLVLKRHGITRALLAAGGDVAVGDPPPDEKAWKVEVAALSAREKTKPRFLMLVNQAVSTSGDVNQYLEIGGRRYSHIVDPKTGIGLPGRMSVTVVAKKGIDSDGLATAAAVLGPEKGLALVEKEGAAGLFVRWIDGKLETTASKSFPND